MIVRDRREMARLLDERMNRTYSSLSERQQLERDTTLVKTYLLEAHLPETAETGQAEELIKSAFKEALPKPSLFQLHPAEESSLVTIQATARDERVTAYIDFTNPRYWLLHSMGGSNALKWIIHRLTSTSSEIDRAWFPADLLEYASKLGAFRGLNLDYDRRQIPDVDFDSDDTPAEFLKMQLWGNRARRVFEVLRAKDAFPHETTLSKVKVKFWLNGDVDQFSLDDIKYNGKVTARGTSFDSHIALITHIYDIYANQIQLLEDRFALRICRHEDEGVRFRGEPINFVFKRPIANLEIFCRKVFSCSEPFRLWGVPVRLSEHFYRVQAVDLHVESELQFEIAPDYIRVYLPAGSCGNSILRFYTNFQHHYDALVGVEDGEGNQVFEF